MEGSERLVEDSPARSKLCPAVRASACSCQGLRWPGFVSSPSLFHVYILYHDYYSMSRRDGKLSVDCRHSSSSGFPAAWHNEPLSNVGTLRLAKWRRLIIAAGRECDPGVIRFQLVRVIPVRPKTDRRSIGRVVAARNAIFVDRSGCPRASHVKRRLRCWLVGMAFRAELVLVLAIASPITVPRISTDSYVVICRFSVGYLFSPRSLDSA